MRESGMKFADDMSVDVFSNAIESYLNELLTSLLPENSSSTSPFSQDISEETLMKELEGGNGSTKDPVRISVENVKQAIHPN